MTRRDEKKLEDKDYDFCTRCNEQEVADEIITINTNNGMTTTERLCRNCIKEEYPTFRKCEGCGSDETDVHNVVVIDKESGDKRMVPICEHCLEVAVEDGIYEKVEG